MLGNSVTIAFEPVTNSKYGTVQLPVISGFPSKVAVNVFSVVGTTDSGTTSPVIVDNPEFTDVEDSDDIAVEAVVGVTGVKVMLARALESPDGEHPTKSGAVSLTAAHSCLLN